ncbi:MAG: AAA family ATPase, partial [Spirochaetes bacterium]|nr:AAA family ATPase [Spirochaetota bacterium]
MNAFHTIAIPHKDILEGRLTMDIFAADLWEAYHNRGPAEYKDSALFFQKTYMTKGLTNLMEIILKRINGKGGDPTIQIQTPFGGGKTHSLIAIMHKAKEWNAKVIVIVGTNLSATDTLWSIIEKQLTGSNKILTERTSPGKEKLKQVLLPHQPLVILMDELLEYITKAAGTPVESSTLAAQTMAFMQELTEVISILEKTALIVTLPSSIMEHYDHEAERFYSQLQKVVGRIEKIYTPVDESEIAKVIRQRLFVTVNHNQVINTVQEFVNFIQNEGILPAGMEATEYRDRFINSYPFLPEVIDVLYQRWGSFPTFQRTRGVLRLLSLVVASLKDSTKPYISLADFNLANPEIRQELLKHIGNEYNSVIAQDITDAEAGSKKIDISLGDAYKGLHLATRASTTIFMYSFSGGLEKGSSLAEIKRSATTVNNPASVVAEAVEQLKSKLFYFQVQNDRYLFSNQPNINRIVLTKMENINEKDITELEFELLKQSLSNRRFQVYIWQEDTSAIADNEDLKLVVLRQLNPEKVITIIKNKGNTPRVNCNTIFFLVPLEIERQGFLTTIKKYKAYQAIDNDKSLPINDDQRKLIKSELKKLESDVKESIRKLYRTIIIPTRDAYKEDDLGIPTYGVQKSLDEEIYEKLKQNNDIIEKLAPLVIKEKYLGKNEYIVTEQIANACYRTPGEPRLQGKIILQEAITEGVEKGLFGLGLLNGNTPQCTYYKEKASVSLTGNEIIIRKELCEELIRQQTITTTTTTTTTYHGSTYTASQPDVVQDPTHTPKTETHETLPEVNLQFQIPKGRASDIFKMVTALHSYFDTISLQIIAR